jgi:TRAP-type C4-dicarboxylate transport system permease small subunit
VPDEGHRSRWLAAIHRIEDVWLALLLGALVVLAPLQIVLRNLFDSGLVWLDPFLRVLVLWVALFGALAASRQDKQIAIDVASRFLTPRVRAAVGALTHTFTVVVCAVLALHSARFVLSERSFGGVAFAGVPSWVCELALPIAFALIALRHVRHGVARAAAALATPSGGRRAGDSVP